LLIWDSQGTIWEGFYDKYPKSLTDNQQWCQGYRDGAICTHTILRNTIQDLV
jgi:hypothetical protein